MDVKIAKQKYSGTVKSICSKSEAHRIMIASALCDDETVIKISSSSKDIEATAKCLESLGATFTFRDDKCTVTPIKKKNQGKVTLDCYESGSTIRFLLPVCAALGVNAEFIGEGRLPERPQNILLNMLRRHGVTTTDDDVFPIEISGHLSGGNFEYAGNVSSQYTTGLLLALPLLDEGGRITLTDKIESRPYIDITVNTLKKFGVDVKTRGNIFSVSADAKYKSPGIVSVGGDWSNGAFFLCLGAFSENGITVTGLDTESGQGDREILNILRRIGADVTVDGDAVTVKKNNLNGIEIDASETPDLMPVVSAVLMFASGKSRIYSAGRLRIKECDRLEKIVETINEAGGNAKVSGDEILIYPTDFFKSDIRFNSFNDHRMVMMQTIISSRLGGEISDFEAVNKSYPALLDDLNSLKEKR